MHHNYLKGTELCSKEKPVTPWKASMLILTRKPGQSLYIGGRIKITVMEIRGNQIRLGIEAPRDERIYREEIFVQIQDENRSAADFDVGSLAGMEMPTSKEAPSWMSTSAIKGLASRLSSGEAPKAMSQTTGSAPSNAGQLKGEPAGQAPEKKRPEVSVKRKKNRDQ